MHRAIALPQSTCKDYKNIGLQKYRNIALQNPIGFYLIFLMLSLFFIPTQSTLNVN